MFLIAKRFPTFILIFQMIFNKTDERMSGSANDL